MWAGRAIFGGVALGVGSNVALASLSRSHTSMCEAMSDSGGPSFRQQLRYTISDAVERVAASVVSISCTKNEMWMTVGVAGSGFIIDSDGTILTNAHVVEGSSEVLVTLQDGQQLVGRVENYDSLSDVAIVKIKGGKSLHAATLGKSSDLRVGEWIIAYGSPGELKDTVTVGIVSALLRQSSELGLGARRMSYIQTDAAINQGNSGGPLINLDGEVVGISTMKAAYLDGISFAIPIDLAMDMVRQMQKYGCVRRPHLGMKIATISPMVLAELRSSIPGFPPELKRGVIITDVSPSSPASKAGLQGGDIIQEVDGSPIVEAGQIYNMLGDEVGRRISMKVVRAGQRRTQVLNVTVKTEAIQ
ncbi:hypothetical protein GUITHDRAFT_105716 [Guillardia theta CCMP2712]|uniref:PDZ domain-containing protein n=2 Tax=Guillardia theta TaxID=55529 RepID=L1JJ94_GUITC|nr:hypothetical protein GUITHDRAFT_105716 [Guillardia theta CCMP2712]EKX48571.1 hypothetical protein GUITHDRAFT_105716 [Guillardia theta CCMP2712]|eukprot:XP_005835551.1 hypothetical protein GUITHDRAFT_105716 [Guillardia theta CCMP2712]